MNLVDILQMSKEQARTYLERVRWPNGPVCPRCTGKDITKLKGKSTRPGLYKCKDCFNSLRNAQFTITVGTIFEDSHIPLNKWIGAFYLMCSSKKGISANQLHRNLGISYKSAWYLCHRVRLAMRNGGMEKLTGIVESDETFIGGKGRMATRRIRKTPVLALVQRNGAIRVKPMRRLTAINVISHLRSQIDSKAILMTDQAVYYKAAGKHFQDHQFVNHSKYEWARDTAHINTAESFFALLKRGTYGTFHHVSSTHLFRYCDEFGFRFSHRKLKDDEVFDLALKASAGKRLFYREDLATGRV